MKKFLVSSSIFFIIIFVAFLGVFCLNIENPFSDYNIDNLPFITTNKEIMIQEKNGNYSSLNIKGVDITASIPGKYATDYALKEEDYLKWFKQIQDMGANTLRVYNLMDDDFYNAFYEFNMQNSQKLYLLQGIQVTDEANENEESAAAEDFLGQLIKDGKDAVDIIHGKKIRLLDGDSYFNDVSPWVIGYLVGTEWNEDTIAYTDHSYAYTNAYDGMYFKTTEDSTNFEAILAKVMDEITKYESNRYHTQRIIGFVNAPNTDFLEYKVVYAKQLKKYVYIDAEHVRPTEKLESGYYAGYRMYEYCDDFVDYLADDQKLELSAILPKINRNASYGGYFDLLHEYHTMPVLITGYGFSTARGQIVYDREPITEKEQGEKLVQIWEDAKEAKLNGVFISTWQDNWERRSWNTTYSKIINTGYQWHDIQTDAVNYGVLEFVPEETVCYIDGNIKEWQNNIPLIGNDGIELYINYDSECLYIMAKGDEIRAGNPFYIPIDLADDIGNVYFEEKGLTFSSDADFVICIDGISRSYVMVNERYDSTYMNFNSEINGIDPFVNKPHNGPDFKVVTMAVNIIDIFNEDTYMKKINEGSIIKNIASVETGKLRYGNGNPSATNYDSLADYHFGNNCVEIRIPWMLLNVADPTEMEVHQDYYPNYGVKTQKINKINIGIGNGNDVIMMNSIDLEGIGKNQKYTERMKYSYYILQTAWNCD